MSSRLIAKYVNPANSHHVERMVKVYWNSDLREYVCKLFIDGKHYEPADYFTDALEDARSSGYSMSLTARERYGDGE